MRVVELFAGAGGAALGLHRAGFEHVALCEWDRAACATLRAAMDAGLLDRADVLEGDVRAVDWSPYVGRVDALWASPPCQDWSTAGKREGAKGERNGWPWTLDVLDAVRPAWFMAENVDGMLKHAGRAHPGDGPAVDVDACPACWFRAKLLPELHARFASVQWTVWDAASLVVPQHRRRLILVCGPTPIRWPEERAAHPELARQGRLFGAAPRPYATIREALGWGPSQQMMTTSGSVAGFDDREVREVPDGPSPPLTTQAGKASPWMNAGVPFVRSSQTSDLARPSYVLDPKHPPADPDAPVGALRSGGGGHSAPPAYIRTEMTGAVAQTTEAPAPALNGKGNTYLHGSDPGVRAPRIAASEPWRLDGPAPAVTGGSTKSHVNGRSAVSANKGTRQAMERAGIRRLSVAECAALQSFPAEWPWQGTQTERYRQVGNAVPPPLAEAVGRAVLEAAQGRVAC